MTDSIRAVLLIFLSVDALALLVLFAFRIRREWKRHKIRHFGDRAEEKVKTYLENEFPNGIVLNNVFLKTARSTTQLDHILLCKWGIFVIETKSHNGKINIGKDKWVQIYGEKVISFHSPLRQNETHRQALVNLLRKNKKFRNLEVMGLVVFTSKKVHFSRREKGVLRLEEVGPYIKSGGEITGKRRSAYTAKPNKRYLSQSTVEALGKHIRRGGVRSQRRKWDHERTLRSKEKNFF